jgi:hypothetical protein
MARSAALMLVCSIAVCGCAGFGDGSVELPHTCVVKANRPHASGHVPGRINSQVSIRCGEDVTDVSVHIRLEEQNRSGGWTVVAEGSNGPRRLAANNKLDVTASITCRLGAFRTTGDGRATSSDGTFTSPTYHSEVVRDPCR